MIRKEKPMRRASQNESLAPPPRAPTRMARREDLQMLLLEKENDVLREVILAVLNTKIQLEEKQDELKTIEGEKAV